MTVDKTPGPVDKHSIPGVLSLFPSESHARLVLSTLSVTTDSFTMQAGIAENKKVSNLAGYSFFFFNFFFLVTGRMQIIFFTSLGSSQILLRLKNKFS